MLSVSRATIVLPCMAMTDKSESLSVVIVDLSQVWSLRRQENDLSASVLPIGKTARIFSSSRILGKKIPSAWLAIMDATDSSGIASCLFQWFDQRNSSLSNAAGSGRICSHFSFRTLRRLVTAFSSFLLITSGTRAHSWSWMEKQKLRVITSIWKSKSYAVGMAEWTDLAWTTTTQRR